MNRVFDLNAAEQALCHAVAGDQDRAIAAAKQFVDLLGEERAFAMAKEHEVASHIAHALKVGNNLHALSAPWQNEHEMWKQRLITYLAELDRIANTLAMHNIPLVALKNAGIARALYPCVGCCPMGDIDALVVRADFRRAHRLLCDLDYHLEFRSPLENNDFAAAETAGSAEYRTRLSTGETLWFELQWRAVCGRWIQPDQEPNADDLIARSRPIAGSAARLLAAEDNLLQVALHTAKHSYVRAPGFRLHTDVDRIVRCEALDWDRFVGLVKQLRVRTAAYYALEIPRQIFDTPVPNEVCQALAPHRSKQATAHRLLRQAGLFHPTERKFTRLGYLRFVSLLYDDSESFWRAVVPGRQSMRERYGEHRRWQLPLLHARRLAGLLFRRLST